MKAIVYETCGSPDVLRCEEIQKPPVRDQHVLTRVRAASVNALELSELKAIPYLARIVFGLRKPVKAHPARLGVDVAGEVVAVGRKVTRFKPKDKVFGVCINDPHSSGAKVWVHDQGAFAEYAGVPESPLAMKPQNDTFEQAAAAGIVVS